MTSDQVRTALKAVPFKPFAIRTADGREYFVSHPEAVLFSASGRTIVVATPEDTLDVIDLLLVAALSFSDRQPRRRKAS